MKEQIEKILNDLRPTIQADGGDVDLVDVDEKKGVVKVRLQGACRHCPMATLTLEEGIGRAIKTKIKGIKKIEAV